MLLKNNLIEVFKKASSENNFSLKETIVVKWVHRFGVDSLNDLLIHSPSIKENQNEEENQEKSSLMNEVCEEEKQEQIRLEFLRTSQNPEETKRYSNDSETLKRKGILSKNRESNKIKYSSKEDKLPLPYIKNLRKWINNDKKAS